MNNKKQTREDEEVYEKSPFSIIFVTILFNPTWRKITIFHIQKLSDDNYDWFFFFKFYFYLLIFSQTRYVFYRLFFANGCLLRI